MKVSKDKLDIYLANSCMNYKELSEKSGVSTVTISRMINGKQLPKTKTLGKIAKALNTNVTEIISSEDGE